MKELLGFLLDVILIFLVIYIVYSVFLNRKRKNYKDLKKTDEIKLFISRYNLDMRKTKYKEVLTSLTIINSFILSFTTSVVIRINGLMMSIIVGFITILLLIYSLYEITGKYFKRKEEEENV